MSSGTPENNEEIERLEDQIVLSPDGDPYTDLDALAEGVVVNFHKTIPQVFDYSREALDVLDTYFAQHSATEEFRKDFLFSDLIPMLGAYLGKVLVRQLRGKWQLRAPLLRSRVVVGETNLDPFRAAYETVYERRPLTDVLEKLP